MKRTTNNTSNLQRQRRQHACHHSVVSLFLNHCHLFVVVSVVCWLLLLPTAKALLPCSSLHHTRVKSSFTPIVTDKKAAKRPSLLLISRRPESPRRKLQVDAEPPVLPATNNERKFEWKSMWGMTKKTTNNLDWVNFGISWVYLAQFSSMYIQLPGLFGPTGLLPISDRISDLVDESSLWVLHLLPSTAVAGNELFGLELFAALGIATSTFQIARPGARNGIQGVLSYGLQWFLWHDLVACGGRFTAYQMDELILDAAPLTLLTSSGISPAAATFGFRWLLSRLYLGAGAVKLLSCDLSWRNLSAIHWHFQSQPLPNSVGAAAYETLPDFITHPLTLAVLVIEMAAPYLFLAPSKDIRRAAFVLNTMLMVGIALFGDFGTLQALLIVIGLVLLDDLPLAPGVSESNNEVSTIRSREDTTLEVATTSKVSSVDEITHNGPDRSSDDANASLALFAISALAIATAAAGAFWAVADVNSACRDSPSVEPLAFALIALGAVASAMPLITDGAGPVAVVASVVSLALLSGSTVPLLDGLGVRLPYEMMRTLDDSLNLGARPYGLFAIITGVCGRPVASIEAANSADGPWTYVPFLYQINDPSSPLPLCFPHFPRLDWTLWFVPLGQTGKYIESLCRGIVTGDPAIVDGLLDGPAFRSAFPDAPPEFVRVVPRIYELFPPDEDAIGAAHWLVTDDLASPMPTGTFSREFLLSSVGAEAAESSSLPSLWPSLLEMRTLPGAAGMRPEHFVWECLAVAELVRRAASPTQEKGGCGDDAIVV